MTEATVTPDPLQRMQLCECGDKRRYATLETARAQQRDILLHTADYKEVYLCRFCHFWHLGGSVWGEGRERAARMEDLARRLLKERAEPIIRPTNSPAAGRKRRLRTQLKKERALRKERAIGVEIDAEDPRAETPGRGARAARPQPARFAAPIGESYLLQNGWTLTAASAPFWIDPDDGCWRSYERALRVYQPARERARKEGLRCL